MADRDTSQDGPESEKPRTGTADPEERLKALGQRIDTARKKAEPPPETAGRPSALGLAFRLSVELVAGLVVGGLIGWQLDVWLGTKPAFLLVFFALGAASGILNVIRTARQMNEQAQAYGIHRPGPPRRDDSDAEGL